jgi:hypothetical protein
MSRKQIRQAVEPLPRKLRDEVLDYAAFLSDVVADRATQLGYELSSGQQDQVVFIASAAHLRDVVAGQLALAQMAATGPSVEMAPGAPIVSGLLAGNQDITPGSPYLRELSDLRGELDRAFLQAGIPQNAHRLSDAIKLVAGSG